MDHSNDPVYCSLCGAYVATQYEIDHAPGAGYFIDPSTGKIICDKCAEKLIEAEEEANSYTGTTNAKANVRSAADASSDKLGSLESGTEITIYGEEGDFYKFDYNGTKAYITKEAVDVGDSTEEETTEDTSEEESTTSAAALTAGDTITLTSTVNIRSAMDSSASKVAVAYAGEEVEVVMSYAEGWTKVKYGKKEGYIRTDLLQE